MGVFPCFIYVKACVAWGVSPTDVFSAVTRSRCKQQIIFAVFKTLCDDGVCIYLFPLLSFQCIFQVPVDDEQLTKEGD